MPVRTKTGAFLANDLKEFDSLMDANGHEKRIGKFQWAKVKYGLDYDKMGQPFHGRTAYLAVDSNVKEHTFGEPLPNGLPMAAHYACAMVLDDKVVYSGEDSAMALGWVAAPCLDLNEIQDALKREDSKLILVGEIPPHVRKAARGAVLEVELWD